MKKEFFDKEYIKTRSIETPGPLETSCWIWQLFINPITGYGVAGTTKRLDLENSAHRLSYQIFYGEIEEHMYICHKCDNPSCVNPDHLFMASSSVNRQDMISKDRQNWAYGERSNSAKLTQEEVLEIRRRWNEEYYRGIGKDLAEEYGVTSQTIYKIKDGNRWRHLNDNE